MRRGYREAKLWKEVHATWGPDQPVSVAVHEQLERDGIRCKIKVIGRPGMVARMLPQQLTSVRVHRDDVPRAYQIIHAMRAAHTASDEPHA